MSRCCRRLCRRFTPQSTLTALQNHLQIKSLTGNLISVTATGSSPAQAESTANAVARSFISYLVSGNSAVGHVRAVLVAPASNATGASLLIRLAMLAVIGAIIGALVGAVAALAVGRRDRRLRERDAIADAIGVPVVASAAVGHPSDPGGWTKLLAEYEPGVIHAWSLRRALNQLGLVDLDLDTPLEEDRPSVAVISLSSDRKALAVGPQLAVFAASLGVRTSCWSAPGRRERDRIAAGRLQRPVGSAPGHPAGCGWPRTTPRWARDSDTLRVLVSVVDSRRPRSAETTRAA